MLAYGDFCLHNVVAAGGIGIMVPGVTVMVAVPYVPSGIEII